MRLGAGVWGGTWLTGYRTAPRCRDPDAGAAFGVLGGGKQAVSCEKRQESNKNAKQQGQWGACGVSGEKAGEQLVWCKEIVLTGRVSTQVLSCLRDRVLQRGRHPRGCSPLLPAQSPAAGSGDLL